MLKFLKLKVVVVIVMLSQIVITHASRERSSALPNTSSHSLSGQVKKCANKILEVYWLKKNEFCDALTMGDTLDGAWYAEFLQSIPFDQIYLNNNKYCKYDSEMKKNVLSHFNTKFPLINNDKISCEEFYCLIKIGEKYDKMAKNKKNKDFCTLTVKVKKEMIKNWVRDERNKVNKNCMHIDGLDNNEQFNGWVSRMIKSKCDSD